MSGKALMVQGTSSWAGKSLVATALCRHFARRGFRVAPFKSQNMSNNARVVEGGEIGTAQYLQALAAGIEPDVRMNPVLVKPEADTQSQVVLRGVVDHELSRRPWRERPPWLWRVIEESLQALLDEYELLIIEGAGSPAEINLRDTDLANMRVAERAKAPVILVSDINRGGAFAHLYGTWALLEETARARIAGFVLNKFRGDASLLSPGPEHLEELTQVPVLGILPWLEHGLPDEDGARERRSVGSGRRRVAVVRYPTASNLDELRALDEVAAVSYVTTPRELDRVEIIVLPGSKHVAADLGWLKRSGLADAIARAAREGRSVLGICGGLQMLGERIEDVGGVDGTAPGLGLLPLLTRFEREKLVHSSRVRFATLAPPWEALSERDFDSYDIRHGQTVPLGPVDEAIGGGRGYVEGNVLGIAVHGLFENREIVEALFGRSAGPALDVVFNQLADALEAHVDVRRLESLLEAA